MTALKDNNIKNAHENEQDAAGGDDAWRAYIAIGQYNDDTNDERKESYYKIITNLHGLNDFTLIIY